MVRKTMFNIYITFLFKEIIIEILEFYLLDSYNSIILLLLKMV